MQNTIRWRSDRFWYTCWRSWRNDYLDPLVIGNWCNLEGPFWYINLRLTFECLYYRIFLVEVHFFSTEKLPRLQLRCEQEWFFQLENHKHFDQGLFAYSTWTHNRGIQFWMLFSIWGLLVLNMWNSSGQFNQQTFMLALYTNGIRHEYLVVVADSSKFFWAVLIGLVELNQVILQK